MQFRKAILVSSGILLAVSSCKKQEQVLNYTPEQKALIQAAVNSVIRDHKRFQEYKENPMVGSVFPSIDFPVITGRPAPDWKKPMLLTFGSAFAPPVKYLHEKLKNKGLQMVHVVYLQDHDEPMAPLNTNEIQEFDPAVSVLNAYGKAPALLGRLKDIGIASGGYAFLLDGNRKVVFTANNIGLDVAPVEAAVLQWVEMGETAVASRPGLNVGDRVDLQGLPEQWVKSIGPELNRSYALAVIKSPSNCDICSPEYDQAIAEPLQNLLDSGTGVMEINVDAAEDRIEHQDGKLMVHEKASSRSNASLVNRFGVRGYPSMLLFSHGKYLGEVPYRGWNFDDGKKAVHIQALAAVEILKELTLNQKAGR